MGEPHKHAELIKAWADGAQIQVYMEDSTETWADITNCGWHEVLKYRIKPDPPKYPQTSLTADDLLEIGRNIPGRRTDAYIAMANAAIARAIDDGDVVPEAMLVKVAQEVEWAVLAACNNIHVAGTPYISPYPGISAIIAKVKEGK